MAPTRTAALEHHVDSLKDDAPLTTMYDALGCHVSLEKDNDIDIIRAYNSPTQNP